ncbi:unnamed protein product [Rotaria sordida]|uniref:NAD(P)-binding domain-containing protein n=2 Tax=Rotaria sordida TaxID=392033 RepID=A0A819GXU0_9BILA|nr:unnamed protein product [Rotaria sordida]
MATVTEDIKDKIVILGATGPSGLQLVQQALAQGYQVTALVRNPKKLEHIENKNLQVIQCDIMNPMELAKHMTNHTAVLSALGYPGLSIWPITFYEDSIKSIVLAMRNANIKRFIGITSTYSKYQSIYPFMIRYLIRPIISRTLDSMFNMEQYLEKECQDLEYTIIRPPGLTNNSIIEQEVKVCENDYYFPDQSTVISIPRANVARFMLDILKDNKYIRQEKVLIIQHSLSVCSPYLTKFFSEHNASFKILSIFDPTYQSQLPNNNTNDYSVIVILDGPQSAYEDDIYPYLKWEKSFLAAQLALNTPILGICLRAPLLADVIGGHSHLGKYDYELGYA